MFKSYPNSFTTDDAATNLASLRFSQSNRLPDPNDPGRIITTTTTTTFSMARDIAKGICQHFLDARLIESAIDRDATQFKDRGIFQLTPKGLHVLERFVTKNGISAQMLVQARAYLLEDAIDRAGLRRPAAARPARADRAETERR